MVDLLANVGRSPKPPEIQGTKIRFCNFIGFHIFSFFSRQLCSLALSFLPLAERPFEQPTELGVSHWDKASHADSKIGMLLTRGTRV